MLRFAMVIMLALGCCAVQNSVFGAALAPLQEGSRPPDFMLPDTAGHSVRLHVLLGRKRIALLFLPRSGDAAAQRYLQTLARARTGLEARDLAVLAVAPPKSVWSHWPGSPPVTVLRDDTGQIARKYGAGGSTPVFYLIGKDGGIKIARTIFPSLRELYAIIDAMPMRREEMRRRGR